MLKLIAHSAATVALFVALFGAGANSATAPEPARLISSLSGSTGASASGVLVYSNTSTRVLKWSATYVSTVSPPAAGTPCATADMGTGTTTYKTIQAYGTYRRCI